MMVHTFFLPIFTAAKDEKYFKGLTLTTTLRRLTLQKGLNNPYLLTAVKVELSVIEWNDCEIPNMSINYHLFCHEKYRRS